MLRPFRITLDRFINRRRSKDIYETGFFLFFHIFPAFLQNRLKGSLTSARCMNLRNSLPVPVAVG